MAEIKLDRFDRAILNELQKNARISNQELAERVSLTPSPCLRRHKQLEESGLIQSYEAVLNARSLGLNLMALVHVGLDRHTPERIEHFEQHAHAWPEVTECLLIAGQSADYQIKVVVRDMDEYQDFILKKLTQVEGVQSVNSSFVLRQALHSRALPV